MNRQELERGLVRGTRLAMRRALSWSAGELWPGDTGAENLIQVSVADAIHRTAVVKPAIHLEPTLSRIAPSVFPNDTRRVDIGLTWAGSPEGQSRYFSVVEIKKHPGGADGDLAKIHELLDRVESIRHGFLVTYFQKHQPNRYAKSTLQDRVDRTSEALARTAKRLYRRGCAHLDPVELGRISTQEGEWQAAALITRFDRDC